MVQHNFQHMIRITSRWKTHTHKLQTANVLCKTFSFVCSHKVIYLSFIYWHLAIYDMSQPGQVLMTGLSPCQIFADEIWRAVKVGEGWLYGGTSAHLITLQPEQMVGQYQQYTVSNPNLLRNLAMHIVLLIIIMYVIKFRNTKKKGVHYNYEGTFLHLYHVWFVLKLRLLSTDSLSFLSFFCFLRGLPRSNRSVNPC